LVNFGKNRICLLGGGFWNEIHHMSFEFAVVQGEEHKGTQDETAQGLAGRYEPFVKRHRL